MKFKYIPILFVGIFLMTGAAFGSSGKPYKTVTKETTQYFPGVQPSWWWRIISHPIGRFTAASGAIAGYTYNFTDFLKDAAQYIPKCVVPSLFKDATVWSQFVPATKNAVIRAQYTTQTLVPMFEDPKRVFACVLFAMSVWGLAERIYRGGIPGFPGGTDGKICGPGKHPELRDLVDCMPYSPKEALNEAMQDVVSPSGSWTESIKKNVFHRITNLHISDYKRMCMFGAIMLGFTHLFTSSGIGQDKLEMLITLLKTGGMACVTNALYKRIFYPWRHEAARLCVTHYQTEIHAS